MNEARSIRSTLESLSRVSHARSDQPTAISVSELLADMEQLYRPEFLQRSIEFQVNVAPGMPRILCGAQQLRQALLHCLQYAIGAVERESPEMAPRESKAIRLEAAREGSLVHISVTHSGPGFLNPERAFDPFVPARAGGETAGMGLSLCATILRDQNGRASAVNLQPRAPPSSWSCRRRNGSLTAPSPTRPQPLRVIAGQQLCGIEISRRSFKDRAWIA